MKPLIFILESKDRFATICVKYVNRNGDRIYVNTPFRILRSEWSATLERPANIYEKANKELNDQLNFLKIELGEAVRKRLKLNIDITKRWLIGQILTHSKQNKPRYVKRDILYYISQYTEARKDYLELSTLTRYKVFYELFYRFEGYCQQRIFLKDINESVIDMFYEFGLKEGYSENTIRKSIGFLKTVMTYYHSKGKVKEFPSINERPLSRQSTSSKTVITLNETELYLIYHTPVSQELEVVKDWLMISCYSGQRVSDFMKFHHTMIRNIGGKQCIDFIQHKTRKRILLPLHPVILEILAKYEGNFPPKINPRKYNSEVKKIAKASSINQRIEGKKCVNHRVKSGLYENGN